MDEDLAHLDYLYERLDSLDINKESDRQNYVVTLAGIMALEASMIMDSPEDSREKIAILVEAFAEAFLGVIKTWLLINPQIHPKKLVTDIFNEFKVQLEDWYPKSESEKLLN